MSTRSKREWVLWWLLIGSLLPLCWLGMMLVHEMGHVLGAWWTGGSVARVVVHPIAISRTDLAHNPCPRFVAWSGPVFGVLAPLLAYAICQAMRLTVTPMVRFFAGFCLISNGMYLGIGSFEGVGDAGTVLADGSPKWVLWGFGALTVPVGFWLWHRLGVHFGIGPDAKPVGVPMALGTFGLLVAVLVLTTLTC